VASPRSRSQCNGLPPAIYDVRGVPVRPVRIVLAAVALLVLAMRAAARRSALARSVAEGNVVSASTRPGNRAVTSWNSQPLPSGSLNEAKEP